MKTDVVVIGGGIAGLAAGALLAKRGYGVTVLEKGNQPGGRAYTYVEKGFTLNYGPHAVYRPSSGVLADVLKRLDRPNFDFGWPDPMKSYWSDGDRFGAIGAKPHQVLTTKLFPLTSRIGIAQAMLSLRSANVDAIDESLTWGDWIDAHTKDPILRRFLRAFGTVNTYTRPSRELSAKFMVGHLKRNVFAKDYVGYLSGGWSTMYRAFIEEIERGGGRVHTGAHVERLEIEGGSVRAAIVNGERYEAEAFVCALPPQDAPSIAETGSALATELAPWSDMDDVRALCMDLGFSRRVRTESTFVYDVEHDLYFSLHSEVTPDLAPEGGQLLHAMAYLSPEEAADDALLAVRRDELLAGLDRFFDGWRDAIVVERTLPNVRVASARRTPVQFGARAMPLRSAVASNLYYAGDARDLPYNLGEESLASALEASDAIADEFVRGERRPSSSEPVAVG